MQISIFFTCLVVSFICLYEYVDARRKQRRLIPGAGINFPRWPLSKNEAEKSVRHLFIYLFIIRSQIGDGCVFWLGLFLVSQGEWIHTTLQKSFRLPSGKGSTQNGKKKSPKRE